MATAKKKRSPTATRRRAKPLSERHVIGLLFGVCAALTLFLGTLLFALDQLAIPGIQDVSHYQPRQATLIYDRDGAVVDRVFEENRIVIGLDKMPPLLPKAFIAAEDARFYEHPGLDLISVVRALITNIRRGGKSQGGSTITQQVAKGLLLSPEKTYLRKFKEAILAWRIDRLLSKDEIIYIYLNQIYLGAGAYGVEAAALTYFDKHAAELNLSEIALLAGLPQAPSRYSPKDHWDRARSRQRYVLNRMAVDGYISAGEAQAAYTLAPRIRDGIAARGENGYYLQEVRRRAAQMIDQPLASAGLRIHTNLDGRRQRAAHRAIAAGIEAVAARNGGKPPPEAALVCLEACSGKVRALVGGSDFARTPFNRAVQAKRPAGSVFKPLVYSAAFEQGWGPDTVIEDTPISISGADGRPWQPQNFSGRFHGPVPLRTALIHSYNIPAIKTLKQTGIETVRRLAGSAGVTADLPPDLSLALGAVDVSLLEMSGAYEPFVCNGGWVLPTLIEKIAAPDGTVLYRHAAEPKKVMSGSSAARMKALLVDAVTAGTGRRAAGLPGVSGGKTGTSDDNRDAWFIGFHDRMIAGVWVGHDRNETLGPGENGGRTAAPIWRDFMASAVR